MAGSASISAQNGGWQGRIDLEPGSNRIRAQGSWVFDPGRDPIGPGGNGTVAPKGYPFSDGIAGEGCLLVQEGNGFINYFTSNAPLIVQGPGHVQFMMNDDNHADNSGTMLVVVDRQP